MTKRNENEAATIFDIAKQCNVATSTVSKALNGYSGVNPDTRTKILEAANHLKYKPNIVARSLVKKSSNNIGVILNIDREIGIQHLFFSQILNAVKNILDDKNIDMTFLNESGSVCTSYIEHCQLRLLDAVFIFGYMEDIRLKQLIESRIVPIVALDYLGEGVTSINCDAYHAAKTLTNYFFDMGHRNILFLSGEDGYTTGERVRGFFDAYGERGVERRCARHVFAKYYDRTVALKQTLEILTANKALPEAERVTGIMYSDDYTAMSSILSLKRMGITVPEDISVAGFDGLDLCELIEPRLVTMRQNPKMIAEAVAQKLLKLMGGSRERYSDVTVLSTELVAGLSVGTNRLNA